MSLDGSYTAERHGWRCDDVHGPTVCRKDSARRRDLYGDGSNIHILQFACSTAMLVPMNTNLVVSVVLAASLFASGVNAGLYKGLDAEGNVVYSDTPFENAKEFKPPSLTVVDAPKTKEKPVTEEAKSVEFKYTDFDIVSPANNETIWNEPDIAVSLLLKPGLNIAAGHTIRLILDGSPRIENTTETALRIGRLDRGAHQLQGQVRDKAGKIIARTRVTVIHVKQSVQK